MGLFRTSFDFLGSLRLLAPTSGCSRAHIKSKPHKIDLLLIGKPQVTARAYTLSIKKSESSPPHAHESEDPPSKIYNLITYQQIHTLRPRMLAGHGLGEPTVKVQPDAAI